MRDRKGVDQDWGRAVEDMGEVEGRETIMWEKIYFQFLKKGK